MTSAVVVGSGPNGLAAAIVLARAGLDVTVLEQADTIGGGTRSAELTVPGLLHDVCSAIHPMGVASPFLRSLDLERHGLEWLYPEIDAAHPIDGGTAGALFPDLDRTVEHLGPDGAAWRRLFEPLVQHADQLVAELLGPILHVPRHPIRLAGFGARALLPATTLARRWTTDEARGLFAGMAAHAMQPLTSPTTAGLGLMFGITSHAYGWPAARGGSQAIAAALAAELAEHGGRIETGHRVETLPDAEVVVLDTSAPAAADIGGARVRPRVARSLRRFRSGPGAFKLDLAIEGPVPWADPWSGRAGTVHLGGTMEQVASAEADVARGRMPERPFVLVAQQHLVDPCRSDGDVHPLWAYAHVPAGYDGDASAAILGQLERFAPGVRDQVVAQHATGPAAWEAYNPNYLGGDIGAGANTPWQLLMRPRASVHPYRLGPGLYLCSAATPPGGGVHGMGGFHAATDAVSRL